MMKDVLELSGNVLVQGATESGMNMDLICLDFYAVQWIYILSMQQQSDVVKSYCK